MPDRDLDDSRRGSRLLSGLFWSGIGLAPLAALLLLVGGGFGLRLGGAVAMAAVVLIGLSVALRPDTSAVRLQLEETLLEEVDILRSELREEIANSARATHQTVGERLGAFQQLVETVRAEQRAAHPPPPPPPPTRGAAAVPSEPPTGYGSHPVPPPQSAPPVPPRRHPAGGPPVSAPAANGRGHGSAPVAASAAVGAAAGRRGEWDRRGGAEARPPVSGRAAPGGVYRHTETVQVTRSTYVDEHPAGAEPGAGYADDGYGPGWSTVVPRSRSPEAFEESWTDEKLRDRYGRRPRPHDRVDEPAVDRVDSRVDSRAAPPEAGDRWREAEQWPRPAAPADRGWSTRWSDESPAADPAPGRRRSDSPSAAGGERWASVRTDDRGSELRLGERRASRHRHEDGTEFRIEDRWAAVRRAAGLDGELGGAGGGGYGPPERAAGRREPDYRPAAHRAAEFGAPDYSPPALPAASSEPSWNEVWEEPVRQTRGHRYRADDDGDGGYGGRRRQFDFEVSDERWR